jgi:hypothetical protein
MKRGVNSSDTVSNKKIKLDAENKAPIERMGAEQALKDSPFAMLVNDATKVILDNLPEYSFMGDNAVNQVCHYFNSITKEYRTEYNRQITKEELLKNCRDEIDALHILRDNALCGHLSIDEILDVTNFVPGIIEALLKSKMFNSDPDILNALGTKNLQAAKKLIDNQKQERNQSGLKLFHCYLEMAPYHYEIAAEYVYKKDRKLPYGSPDYINNKVLVGKHHAKLALDIITEFGDRLSERNLVDLAQHFEVFLHIMNCAHLRTILGMISLYDLGCQNYQVAEYIANDSSLRIMFDDNYFNSMQYHHPEKFNEKALLDYLNHLPTKIQYGRQILLSLCKKSKELIIPIFSTEQFYNIVSPYAGEILEAHKELLCLQKTIFSITRNRKISIKDQNYELFEFIYQIANEIDPADILERQMRSQLTL